MKTELTFGQILTGTYQRDAVHVAVSPMVANEKLKPGEHFNNVTGKKIDGHFRCAC